ARTRRRPRETRGRHRSGVAQAEAALRRRLATSRARPPAASRPMPRRASGIVLLLPVRASGVTSGVTVAGATIVRPATFVQPTNGSVESPTCLAEIEPVVASAGRTTSTENERSAPLVVEPICVLLRKIRMVAFGVADVPLTFTVSPACADGGFTVKEQRAA